MRGLLIGLIVLLLSGAAAAEDLRVVSRKAQADFEQARQEASRRRQEILEDKEKLTAEVQRGENRVKDLNGAVASLQKRLEELNAKDAEQGQKQSEVRMDLREFTGVVRETARDLEALLNQSQFTALQPGRLDRLAPVLDNDRFPGMEEIALLSDLFFEETALSGEIDRHAAAYIDRDGSEATGEILTIGAFSAVYRNNGEVGFLRYAEGGQRLFALSNPPPWTMRRNIKRYMNGDTDEIVFDFSRGAALRQLVHRSTLMDKIEKGGPVVWPILGIGVLALFIALERIVFLNRVHANTDRLMGSVNELAGQGDWAGCDKVLMHDQGKPVNNVLRAGLSAVNEKRETLESVLQEAILKELPRLERFLPALNILGAVAPLLGLLGTVTGMIETFRVITLHGAGDPRMMSGGISEALVTTMLGLSVAIPIMLVHTFLRRRLDHIVGDMEEKAVALSNIICRECTLVSFPGSKKTGPGQRPMHAQA
ncbi:MotA/TolQ/ExbB proton channel family protein [uncultured Desulfosarcina sp.]|uniref:MotA/TolQ/ExbB proton channel family protein n=1 Tax=uncultured Desulfosarcina sp. TaxID=218289 RepID=UPI0029C98E99|nr:MotA/TolQ/ExbB proton channel family protein [uncultured Desulfosarcina sp.]